MKTEVYARENTIEIEFTLIDDCKFNVTLTASDAEDISRKLCQAAECARNGKLQWRDRID